MAVTMDRPSSNLRKRKSNGNLNSDNILNGKSTALLKINAMPTEHGQEMDKKLDEHQSYEFGGPVGVTAMMVGFPLLMYYLWICLWFYRGKFVYPTSVDDIRPFLNKMGQHIYEGAYPTKFAWVTYCGLTAIQLIFAQFMPGLTQNGLPVPSLGYKALPYHCNALYSWYATLLLAYGLHKTGVYRLPWIIENYGPIMTVALIVSFSVSILIDVCGRLFHYGGKPMRLSGNVIYDHFMGITLNPRLGRIDLKMFAEVRVPWVLLFLISLSGVVKQYEEFGRVSYNMWHMLLATGLYINACAKGEHMIPQTWDMFHEKFGWMLIFWNMAGVPFTYCYPVIYMARAPPSTYEFPLWGNIAMFVTLVTFYYIFDCSMAQKSNFKMHQQGEHNPRKAFPVLYGSDLKNPTYIQTKHGNKLLTGGLWRYARKINYTADWIQACTWGLTAGFNTPITMFYPIFFLAVLTHRCGRDFAKCSVKYGEDWDEYCKVVRWKFIPYIY
ncbi:delta24(24(1))-sterol reductase [Kwoniella mangroviensis CBS 10435]|uniref:Delta(24(24(1)))-sterol reductase n=1 Tax=Kwoniella mangroviensis CBS 10435 TaxID=1331196 RepID=A0A1B9IJG6_9TREE|nr:delta24(24(1))-sterol reductase [Kwoniella mangroviensis CBS 10435]